MSKIVYCACGKPLHYTDRRKQAIVEEQCKISGPDLAIKIKDRTWLVPRHYLALHDVTPTQLPSLKFPELVQGGIVLSFIHDADKVHSQMHNRDYADQIFTHIDDDCRVSHFHIPKLQAMISREPNSFDIGIFPIDTEIAEFVRDKRGVDPVHLASRMSPAFIDEPGIICLYPDSTQLTVDGNHRLVKRVELGRENMAFYLVEETYWRKALLRVPSFYDSI